MPHIDDGAVRWGILGVAAINDSFLPGLRDATGSEVGAIASRSLDRAQAAARRWAIDAAYGSYDELLASTSRSPITYTRPGWCVLSKRESMFCVRSR